MEYECGSDRSRSSDVFLTYSVRILLLLVFSRTSFVSAQQLEPRAYSPSPVGTSFLAVGLSRSSGGVTFDPTVPITDVQATLYATFIGVGRTFGIFGRQSLINAALPYVWGDLSGQVGEQSASITRSGLAPLHFRLAFNILGSPALKPKEFAATKHDKFILAASLSVDAPTGQYNSAKLINLATNRWAFRPEIGFSQPIKKLNVDLYTAANLFTTNQAFFPGNSTRSQDMLGSIQAHLSYTVRRGLWLAFDSTWYGGGAVHVNDGPGMSRQSNTRLGGTVSLPIGKLQSIKVAYSSGVTARAGTSFQSVGVSWQCIRFDRN